LKYTGWRRETGKFEIIKKRTLKYTEWRRDLKYTGWRRDTGKFEIIRKKRRKLTKLYLILKMCSTRVEISLGVTFLKITSVKCCPFRCTHSEDAARCVLWNVGDVFLSWARFVGLVWYTTLWRSGRPSDVSIP
jgi:hypothetical protein